MNDELYIIHADLKPGNILISGGITNGIDAYLSDLSCVLDEGEYTSGSVGGTLYWLLPEMAESIYIAMPKKSDENDTRFMCTDAYGIMLNCCSFIL